MIQQISSGRKGKAVLFFLPVLVLHVGARSVWKTLQNGEVLLWLELFLQIQVVSELIMSNEQNYSSITYYIEWAVFYLTQSNYEFLLFHIIQQILNWKLPTSALKTSIFQYSSLTATYPPWRHHVQTDLIKWSYVLSVKWTCNGTWIC